MKKVNVLIISLLIGLNCSFAGVSPAWNIQFKGNIIWQRVTPLGQLVVNTSTALVGVDPVKGEIIWEKPGLASIPESGYEEIGETEFISVATGSNDNPDIAIVNTINGEIVFNTANAGISEILDKYVLPRSGVMLLVVVKLGNTAASLVAININTGKQLWTNDDLFKIEDVKVGKGGKFGAMLGALATQAGNAMNAQGLLCAPFELSADKMILLHPNYVYMINPETGEAYWKSPMQTAVAGSIDITPYRKGTIFIGRETEEEMQSMSSSSGDKPTIVYKYLIYALNESDGKNNWPEPFVAKGQLNRIIFDQAGVIVCPRDNKPFINLLDYNTGAPQWGKKGKGNKIQGSIVSYSKLDGKYVITTGFDNAFTNKGEEYYINVLDPGIGMMKFDKFQKLNGDLRYSELVDKGIFYVTSRELNILDLTSGENLLEPIEAAKPLDPDNYDPRKHGLPFTIKGNMVYAYSSKDGMLYEIDKQKATAKVLTKEKIKFEGKERPFNIELTADGIILSSEQNIMKVGYDGNVMYQTYYPAPKEPALLRAIAAADAMRAAYIGAVAGVYGAAFDQAADQTDDEVGKAMASGMSEGFNELSDAGFAYSKSALAYATARFKATVQSHDFMFILSEYDKRRFGIYQVSKTTGKDIAMIDLNKDKEPNYEIDQIYNFIYYRVAPNEIVCYKF